MFRSLFLLTIFLLVTTCSQYTVALGEVMVRADPISQTFYEEILGNISQNRNELLQQYNDARTEARRAAVLNEAADQFLCSVVEEIAPFWYGTPWDYNGMTEVPGTDSIACGYFVTTVLRDMGVVLNRFRLAQEPSEAMIRSLVSSDVIRRFSDVSIDSFVAVVREWGVGLYIVGLDIHVGFLICDARQVSFLHSSYQDPLCVLRENARESAILAGSRYRVLGKLTGDSNFLLFWLKGESIP